MIPALLLGATWIGRSPLAGISCTRVGDTKGPRAFQYLYGAVIRGNPSYLRVRSVIRLEYGILLVRGHDRYRVSGRVVDRVASIGHAGGMSGPTISTLEAL